MKRNATNYQIKPNTTLGKSAIEQYQVFKKSALSKGVKFMAFNDANGKFAIDSMYTPLITQVLIATKIQANFLSTFVYDDYKSTSSPTTLPTQPVINPVTPDRPAENIILPKPEIEIQKKEEGSGGLLFAAAAILASLLL